MPGEVLNALRTWTGQGSRVLECRSGSSASAEGFSTGNLRSALHWASLVDLVSHYIHCEGLLKFRSVRPSGWSKTSPFLRENGRMEEGCMAISADGLHLGVSESCPSRLSSLRLQSASGNQGGPGKPRQSSPMFHLPPVSLRIS